MAATDQTSSPHLRSAVAETLPPRSIFDITLTVRVFMSCIDHELCITSPRAGEQYWDEGPDLIFSS